MWSTVLDVVTAMAAWPWLAPLTTLLRAVSAVLGLVITTREVIRWRRDQHRDAATRRYPG